MNEEQEEALAFIKSGHNVFISGQAGTGKTYLLKKALHELISHGKKVSVVCPTGIAASQYVKFGGTTIHRWAGLYDGRYSNSQFTNMFLRDEAFELARRNVSGTDILIIDEISMVSEKDFQQLEIACRLGGPNSDRLFGGLQVIACGDFYQLRPVPNTFYPGCVNYCFEAETWRRIFVHRVHLNNVIRTYDNQLILAVRESATGDISDGTKNYLESLVRAIPCNEETVCLHATNYCTDLYNAEKIKKFHGLSKLYKSKDRGNKRSLRKICVQSEILLKIGAPVMLLRNLSPTLVNGLRGRVMQMRDTEVDVSFQELSSNQNYTIKGVTFSVHENNTTKIIASRHQLPLKLAFGITIHKSQGMTIPSLIVNCRGIREPGQFSVALGRGTSSEGIQLIEYSPAVILKHSDPIEHIMATSQGSVPIVDFSCCMHYDIPDLGDDEDFMLPENNAIMLSDLDSTESASSNEESERETTDAGLFENTNCHSSDGNVIVKNEFEEMCKALLNPSTQLVTETQTLRNHILISMSSSPVGPLWLTQQKENICSLFKTAHSNFPKCETFLNWNKFCCALHQHLISIEFRNSLQRLFQNPSVSDLQCQVAAEIMLSYRDKLLKDAVENKVKVKALPVPPRRIWEAGRAKIRDVAGMCVARSRQKYMSIVLTNIYKETPVASERVLRANKKVTMLRNMELCNGWETCDTASLTIVAEKQSVGKSVTAVNDSCFNYFVNLTNVIRNILTFSNLAVHKSGLISHICDAIQSEECLKEGWLKAVNMDTSTESEECKQQVTMRYVKVCAKQFIKDVKDDLKVKKAMALRKTLSVPKSKGTDSNASLSDTPSTSGNQELHQQFQETLEDNGSIFHRKIFLKKDIVSICGAYNLEVKQNWTKTAIIKMLLQEIQKSKCVPNPSNLTDRVLELIKGCNSVSSVKGKGKGKGKKSIVVEPNYYCLICRKEYVEGVEDWIQCDSCEGWVDRTCANLVEEESWEEICIPDIEFICSMCKK